MTDREARDLLFRAKHLLAEAGGYIAVTDPRWALRFSNAARDISDALLDDTVGVPDDR